MRGPQGNPAGVPRAHVPEHVDLQPADLVVPLHAGRTARHWPGEQAQSEPPLLHHLHVDFRPHEFIAIVGVVLII